MKHFVTTLETLYTCHEGVESYEITWGLYWFAHFFN